MAGVRNLVSEEKTHDLSKNLSVIVLADVVVVDILVKLLVFHEENPSNSLEVK